MIIRQVAPLIMTLVLFAPSLAAGQLCLHGPDSTAEQKARKTAALRATRQINTVQANRPEARQGRYLDQLEMAGYDAEQVKKSGAATSLIFDPNAEVIPGWQLILQKTEDGYWFMIKDKTDPCGFAYISNDAGVIYTAEPIR